ncbi:lymphocyte antigen 6D-like isoform X2 [Actinia tenebrosa]|uniref:Lymphocyte antigen 6D-like isoform X2 n=1 Tax=Actinia tenebrosa TaxID=6105 RepID=A0A6P8I5Z6_ACTTE|nr:lymphocyte antigen 6D-like isoform X2 [Actinia tenebrosa]
MKLLIVTLCVLAALIPAALSIKCYVCNNNDGNCVTGKMTCPNVLMTMDTCVKTKTGSAIAKTCSTSSICSTLKNACKNSGKCEAYCCDSDLCNGGVPLKPVTFMSLLAMALAVAKYLM